MHRRLFWSLAGAIGITVVIALVLVRLYGTSPWKAEVERASRFVSHQFASVWDDPGRRTQFAQEMASDLNLRLRVVDLEERTLVEAGGSCNPAEATVPVMVKDRLVGKVWLCGLWHRSDRGHVLIPIAVAVLVLWAASGVMARHLTQPLRLLTQAASEIGRGKLATRVQLHGRSVREVRVLADVLNEMAARIERQLGDQRALLAAVSHELRTPLARMRLLTEMARDQGCSGKTVDAMDREIGEVDVLVGDLLASSRLDFGAQTQRKLRVASLIGVAVDRAGIDPSVLDVPEQPLWLEGDPTLLGRAIANLIDNAVGHGQGVVGLRVGERDGMVVIEVEDAGPGLAPGEERRVFEPFYRKPAAGTQTSGVGLGLALVDRIAKAHQGRAFARNRSEKGACFGLEIPACAPPRQGDTEDHIA